MTESADTRFVLLDQSNSDLILELINSIQPGIPWSIDHLTWQYFRTPHGCARLYGYVNPSGKLVAFYAATCQKIRVKNEVLNARMVQDVMTHPKYRGRGLLHQLAHASVADMKNTGEVGLSFPNERSENSFRRNGWTELCSVPLRKKAIRNSYPKTLDLRMNRIEGTFGSGVTDIWNSSGLAIGMDRDSDYLNWRYSKPEVTYFKFLIDTVDGFLMLKLYEDDIRRTVHICDLVVRGDRRGLVGAVLEFCEWFAHQNNADLMTAWLHAAHPYADVFNEKGLLLESASNRYVFVLPNENLCGEFGEPEEWHLSQGDSDVY